MSIIFTILILLAAVFIGLSILVVVGLCYLSHDDCGAAAERDSREGLAEIEADFTRLQDTCNRF